MSAGRFRAKVLKPNGEVNQTEFDRVWPRLRVLARSTPMDKYALVAGIQASRASGQQTVAVTGDGTNDAAALTRADVGFSMGITGTQVAQNAADIIMMDDNFASIVDAVKWGRCVYDNICKFLQFQLTVNLSACLLTVIGSSILTQSPLSAIQLLWVNMIMDSLASLALATEDPHPNLLTRKPYPRDQPLLSRVMLRSLVGHSLWQLLVLSLLLFALGTPCLDHPAAPSPVVCSAERDGAWWEFPSGRPTAFDEMVYGGGPGSHPCFFDPPSPSPPPAPSLSSGTNSSASFCAAHAEQQSAPSTHYTLVFTTFVMMQLFNQINARKLHGERNVFAGLLQNNYFLGITAVELLLQVLMVQLPRFNAAMGCTPLSKPQWLACILLGASELPVHFLLSFFPLALVPSLSLSRPSRPPPSDDEIDDEELGLLAQ